MFTFPKEVWYIIKSYEYQITHYPAIENIIKDVSIHSFMPYYLSMHEQKGGDKLFDFMLSKKYIWQLYFTDTLMKKMCYKYDRIARDNYD